MNRRHWLKQAGLGTVSLGLINSKLFASSASLLNQPDIPTAGEPVFLQFNENPYGPSPLARKAISNNLSLSNRYHWKITSQLVSAIAEKNNVKDENILVGAGATEILDLIAIHAASLKGNYVIADPTFDYWTSILGKLDTTKKVKIPLTKEMKTDLDAMQYAITPETSFVYICNPNNPTGTICEREALIQFIKKVPVKTLIVADEAYLDFTKEQSLNNLINDYPNLIIVKTFSKIYGLAGARVGFAIAAADKIKFIGNLQSATNNNVSVLSRVAAIESLKDEAFFSKCYASNEAARKFTMDEFKKLNLTYIPSGTNFIYFSLSNYKKDYFKQLKDNHIFGSKIYNEEGKWTRISIGTMEEMQKFIKAIT